MSTQGTVAPHDPREQTLVCHPPPAASTPGSGPVNAAQPPGPSADLSPPDDPSDDRSDDHADNGLSFDRRNPLSRRQPINRGRHLSKQFFEEGERQQREGWQNSPLVGDEVGPDPAVDFESFDQVPSRRGPVLAFSVIAAIGLGGLILWGLGQSSAPPASDTLTVTAPEPTLPPAEPGPTPTAVPAPAPTAVPAPTLAAVPVPTTRTAPTDVIASETLAPRPPVPAAHGAEQGERKGERIARRAVLAPRPTKTTAPQARLVTVARARSQPAAAAARTGRPTSRRRILLRRESPPAPPMAVTREVAPPEGSGTAAAPDVTTPFPPAGQPPEAFVAPRDTPPLEAPAARGETAPPAAAAPDPAPLALPPAVDSTPTTLTPTP